MPRNSMVNFQKVYSIDRDVHVVEFGKVDRDQRQRLLPTLEGIWLTMKIKLSEEERQRRRVKDRNRYEHNQDEFGG